MILIRGNEVATVPLAEMVLMCPPVPVRLRRKDHRRPIVAKESCRSLR